MQIIANCDGACRGNGGPNPRAGAGVVLRNDDGRLLRTVGQFLGPITNNAAEYEGAILALKTARELGATRIVLQADSEVMVRQLNGQYAVNKPHLQFLHRRATDLLKEFEAVEIRHVPREMNFEADEIANKAIDDHESGAVQRIHTQDFHKPISEKPKDVKNEDAYVEALTLLAGLKEQVLIQFEMAERLLKQWQSAR